MWGAKKPMAFSNNHTLISRSAKIIGDLYFDGELQIEGKICGNVIAEGEVDAKVVVAENGVVEGNIQAPAAVINGNVKGDIYSSKHIELAAKAMIEGNIHYQSIEMVKGSQVNGGLIFRDSTNIPGKEFPASSEKTTEKDETQDD